MRITDISRGIDSINAWIARRAMWLNAALVLLIFIDVVLRYLFSSTEAWVIEMEWHLFALIFLLGAAYAYQKDEHVRVDVFYAKWSPRRKAIINLIGDICFLVPWCLIIIWTSFHYAENSLFFHEGSADPGGLPARYLIKFSITVGFVMLLFQAVGQILKHIKVLTGRTA